MTTDNPNAPGFFGGGPTGGSVGPSGEDLYVTSGAVTGQNLVLTLSNSTTVTISLASVFTAGQISGLTYNTANDILTINQQGNSFSVEIPSGGGPATDTFLSGASFSAATNLLTLTRNDGVAVEADLSALVQEVMQDTNTFLSSGLVAGNTATFTLNNGTQVQVDVTTLNNANLRMEDIDGVLVTTNISFNNNRLIDVADPTGPQDAATMNYVDTAVSGVSTEVEASDFATMQDIVATGDADDVALNITNNAVTRDKLADSIITQLDMIENPAIHVNDQGEPILDPEVTGTELRELLETIRPIYATSAQGDNLTETQAADHPFVAFVQENTTLFDHNGDINTTAFQAAITTGTIVFVRYIGGGNVTLGDFSASDEISPQDDQGHIQFVLRDNSILRARLHSDIITELDSYDARITTIRDRAFESPTGLMIAEGSINHLGEVRLQSGGTFDAPNNSWVRIDTPDVVPADQQPNAAVLGRRWLRVLSDGGDSTTNVQTDISGLTVPDGVTVNGLLSTTMLGEDTTYVFADGDSTHPGTFTVTPSNGPEQRVNVNANNTTYTFDVIQEGSNVEISIDSSSSDDQSITLIPADSNVTLTADQANNQITIGATGGGGGGGTSFLTSVVGDDATAGEINFGEGGSTRLQVGNQNNIRSFVASNQLNLSLDIEVWSTQNPYPVGAFARTETSAGGETGNLWVSLVENGPASTVGAVNPTQNDGKTPGGTQVWQRLSTSHIVQNEGGTSLTPRRNIRFTDGGDTTVTVSDHPDGDYTQVNIASTGSSGSGNAVSWAQTGNDDPIPDDGTASSKLARVYDWARDTHPTTQLPTSKVPLNVTAAGIVNWDGVSLNVPTVARNSIGPVTVVDPSTAFPNGNLVYNDDGTGRFVFTPAVPNRIQGSLTGGTLADLNAIQFSNDQFILTTLQVGDELVQQYSLRADLIADDTFLINTDRSSWLGSRNVSLHRPIYRTQNTLQCVFLSEDAVNYPIDPADTEFNHIRLFNSDNPGGIDLTPDQYTVALGPFISSDQVVVGYSSDLFRDADRIEVSWTIGTTAEIAATGVDPVISNIEFTTYRPVISGTTNFDSPVVTPGVDPRWTATFSGTTNDLTPVPGANSFLTLGLLNNPSQMFNSGTSGNGTSRTVTRASLASGSHRLGTVGDRITFTADFSITSRQLSAFRSTSTAYLTLYAGNETEFLSNELTRIALHTNSFTRANTDTVGAVLAVDHGPDSPITYTRSSNDLAVFSIHFLPVLANPNQAQVVIDITEHGASANYLWTQGGSNVGYFQTQQTGAAEDFIYFGVDESDATVTNVSSAASWNLDIDTADIVYGDEAEFNNVTFSDNLGPDAALTEMATAITAVSGITQLGSIGDATDSDGNAYRTLVLDLGTTTALMSNFNISPGTTGSETEPTFVMGTMGDPNIPGAPSASILNGTIIEERATNPGQTFSIPFRAVLGSSQTSDEVAALFAGEASSRIVIALGGSIFFTVNNSVVTAQYRTPNPVPTDDNSFTITIDNGTQDNAGDADVTVVNNVVGATGNLDQLTISPDNVSLEQVILDPHLEFPNEYDARLFYEGEVGSHHHMLIAASELQGDPSFTVRDDDNSVQYPWDTNDAQFYERIELNIFGIPYIWYRFTTGYSEANSLRTNISIRGSRSR